MKKLVRNIIPKFLINRILKHRYSLKSSVRFSKGTRVNMFNTFEGRNVVYNNAYIGSSEIGYGTYISSDSIIKNARIGRFCSIGSNVQTGFGKHPLNSFVSTHPAFFSEKKQAGFTFVNKNLFNEHDYVDNGKKYFVEIGNDVWIGNNVSILDGIQISDGAVIATGSVVTKDVLPYTIVGGVPAKKIKERFNKETTSFLLKFKWWDKGIDWIKKNSLEFQNLSIFIEQNKTDNE